MHTDHTALLNSVRHLPGYQGSFLDRRFGLFAYAVETEGTWVLTCAHGATVTATVERRALALRNHPAGWCTECDDIVGGG